VIAGGGGGVVSDEPDRLRAGAVEDEGLDIDTAASSQRERAVAGFGAGRGGDGGMRMRIDEEGGGAVLEGETPGFRVGGGESGGGGAE